MTSPILTSEKQVSILKAPAPKPKTRTKRQSYDAYYTPQGERAIDLLMQHLPIYDKLRLLEPCAGLGALVEPLERRGHTVMTADLDPGARVKLYTDSATHPWPRDTYDGIITNPPFTQAPRMIRHLMQVPRHFSAYLLRLSFLECCANRTDLLAVDSGLWRIVVTPRYSFRGQGKDSVTTAWFIWRRGHVGYPTIISEPQHLHNPQEDLL